MMWNDMYTYVYICIHMYTAIVVSPNHPPESSRYGQTSQNDARSTSQSQVSVRLLPLSEPLDQPVMRFERGCWLMLVATQ